MTIITPEIKDKVLNDLISADGLSFTFQYSDCEDEFGIQPDYIQFILDEFAELGLIEVTHYVGYCSKINIKAKAMNLYRHGGFTAEEEILKGNIEKLGYELDVLAKQLTPDYTEKATQLSQIGSAIMQALTLFS